MSQDRFVTFPTEAARPSVDEMRCLLEDFFAGAEEGIVWNSDRFVVLFTGQCRDPLRRLGRDLYASEPFDRTPVISVITRHADDYVSALADGIARVVALRWQGIHGLPVELPS